jgi:hypothetical protein
MEELMYLRCVKRGTSFETIKMQSSEFEGALVQSWFEFDIRPEGGIYQKVVIEERTGSSQTETMTLHKKMN